MKLKLSKNTEEKINNFLTISSIIFGIILGLGYMFIGFIWYRFWLIIFGLLATLTGLFATTFLKNEKDYI